MEENNKTWIEEMLEREGTPTVLRTETTVDFCKRHDIPKSTYYYESNKKENQSIILKSSLNLAKKYTPDVMDNLGQRAVKDNKAAELFMNYVLELSKNLDVKSDGKELANTILVKFLDEKSTDNNRDTC